MKKIQLLFFAVFIFLFSVSEAFAICGSTSVEKDTGDQTSCLPSRVCHVLQAISAKFGKVEVVSGYRGWEENRRRGGVSGSMHLECRAADFRVPNGGSRAVQQALANFLRAQKQGGSLRYNVYCTGRTHVDNSDRVDGYETCVNRVSTKRYKRQRGSWRQRRRHRH
jgi:hypothetical protein